MLRTIALRLLDAVPTMVLVLTLVFFALRILPGDPARVVLGEFATPDQIAALRAKMGLDVPLLQQYLTFLWNVATLHFGASFVTGAPVGDMLRENLPYTIELTILATLFGLLLGIPLGVAGARHRGKSVDSAARMFALLGYAIPDFYLGALLLIWFGGDMTGTGDIAQDFEAEEEAALAVRRRPNASLLRDPVSIICCLLLTLLILAAIFAPVLAPYDPLTQSVLQANKPPNVFRRPAHPYTRGLLEAMPRLEDTRDRLFQISGSVPSPLRRPTGCLFAPRCPLRRPICSEVRPPMSDFGATHRAACWIPILSAAGLTRVFSVREGGLIGGRRLQVRAVDDVSFDLLPGETLAVVGESGCGKSTLARLLLRLLAPSAGALTYSGQDYSTATGEKLRDIRRHVQMVFQDPYSSLSPRRTAGQIIAEPLEAYRIVTSAQDRRARVAALLREHPYTDALLSAVPRPDPGARTGRVLLEGDLPSPTETLIGCAFASRCPIVRDRCRVERPLLREVEPGQSAACHFATPQPLAASRRHLLEGTSPD
eukprot:gene2119-2156_t